MIRSLVQLLFNYSVLIVVAMIAFIPMVFIAMLIYINMGRPIFFKQKRPGLFAKAFIFYKFRTMTTGSGDDAERLTPLGRFLRCASLDELPQIINIAKGDMNWVGPRPLLMEYLDLYTLKQARRHLVKPGITGWAQINGRNSVSWDQKFEYDLWYIDNRSFLLDIKILLKTIVQVFKRTGISQQGHATADKFTGNES